MRKTVRALSFVEASFRRREAGRKKKKKRAGHDGKGEEKTEGPVISLFPSSPARLLFFHYCYFYGIPSGNLCGGESGARESKLTTREERGLELVPLTLVYMEKRPTLFPFLA